jgi:predicted Zn-dependent protease
MGYYIENGEICEGIEDVVLGTKLIDLYNRIEAIGSNSKKVGSNVIPSIKFGKTQIGGQ